MSKKEEFKKALVEVRDAIDNLIVVLDATSDEEIEHLEDLPTTIEIIQEPAKEEAKAEEPKPENIQETSFDKFGNVVFKPSIRS